MVIGIVRRDDRNSLADNNWQRDCVTCRKLGACGLRGDDTARGPARSKRRAGTTAPAATPASQLRDLTPQEKKIVVDAIAPSLREPGSAKYKWAKFPIVPPSDEVSYCGIVDANMCATHGLDPNSAS